MNIVARRRLLLDRFLWSRLALFQNKTKESRISFSSSASSDNAGTGSQQAPKNEKELWRTVDPCVLPFIRRGDWPLPKPKGHEKLPHPDTQFHVYFLGTGSGSSFQRLSSCTLLRTVGESMLFDAGEGAKRHIGRSSAKLKNLQKIFITQ